MLVTTPVDVYTIELACDTCGYKFTDKDLNVVWDNKNTTTLADDTMSYIYTCPTCLTVYPSDKKYPYQEFVPRI